MSLVIPQTLNQATLEFTENDVELVEKPFYLIGVNIQHNIGLTPIYYVGGAWPSYQRDVYYQPRSGGGQIVMNGFFKDEDDFLDAFNSLTISETINPNSNTSSSVLSLVDIRVNGKKFWDCYCNLFDMKATQIADVNIIYGTIGYLFKTVTDYTG